MNEEKTELEVVDFDARDFIPDDVEEIVETVNVSGNGNYEDKEVIENEISE